MSKKKEKPTADSPTGEELPLEAFLNQRIEVLKHELAHASNSVQTHSRALETARLLQQSYLYRIDELERLQGGCGFKTSQSAETSDVKANKPSKTPRSQDDPKPTAAS